MAEPVVLYCDDGLSPGQSLDEYYSNDFRLFPTLRDAIKDTSPVEGVYTLPVPFSKETVEAALKCVLLDEPLPGSSNALLRIVDFCAWANAKAVGRAVCEVVRTKTPLLQSAHPPRCSLDDLLESVQDEKLMVK